MDVLVKDFIVFVGGILTVTLAMVLTVSILLIMAFIVAKIFGWMRDIRDWARDIREKRILKKIKAGKPTHGYLKNPDKIEVNQHDYHITTKIIDWHIEKRTGWATDNFSIKINPQVEWQMRSTWDDGSPERITKNVTPLTTGELFMLKITNVGVGSGITIVSPEGVPIDIPYGISVTIPLKAFEEIHLLLKSKMSFYNEDIEIIPFFTDPKTESAYYWKTLKDKPTNNQQEEGK